MTTGVTIMPELATGEIAPSELEASFRDLSLRELSFEAAQIAALLEDAEPDELLERLQTYISEATAAKIDGYCLYKEYLDSEIEAWKLKRDSLLGMCDRVISAKEAQLKALKQNLLNLHEQGLLEGNLVGKNKAITICPNSKPTVEVIGDAKDLPLDYRQAKWVPNKEAIAQAYLDGEDISKFAQIVYGKQVRFKNAPRSRRKED
jgi:hypothetical protein